MREKGGHQEETGATRDCVCVRWRSVEAQYQRKTF